MNNRSLHQLHNPLFLLSVCVLLLNDFIFKYTNPGLLSGKLSDFAGLFAFAFFMSVMFSKQARLIHVLTGMLFICWKSSLSQPIIDWLNQLHLPVRRVVDYSDLIALPSIVLSWFVYNRSSLSYKPSFSYPRLLTLSIATVSVFAFTATSMAKRKQVKYVDINKTYNFSFSKRELISRLNMVQIQTIRSINKAGGAVDFNSKTNSFHFNGHTDTLALLLDPATIDERDTIVFKTSYAEIMISGTDHHSTLTLVSVSRFVPLSDKDYRAQTIKRFEKFIIRKIRKFR